MNNTKKKILISGGTGFLGRYLLSRLGNKYEIIVLSRAPSDSPKSDYAVMSNDDFFNDKHLGKIDLFIHMASDTRKNAELIDSVNANIVFPLEVISKIKNSDLKIINIDSTYYESEKNNYSLTKRHFSELLTLQAIPIMNFKIDNVYGGNDNSSRFIPRILDALFEKVPSINLTEGIQKRDFVHVEDVVGLLERAVEKTLGEYSGYRSFDIGCGKPASIKEAVIKLKELLDNNVTKLNFGAISYAVIDSNDLQSQIDIKQTMDYFNWSPKIDTADGFKQLISLKRTSGQ